MELYGSIDAFGALLCLHLFRVINLQTAHCRR